MIRDLKVRFGLAFAVVAGVVASSELVSFLVSEGWARFPLEFAYFLAWGTAAHAVMDLTWPTFYAVENRHGIREVRDGYKFRRVVFRSADAINTEFLMRGANVRYEVFRVPPGVPRNEVLAVGRRVR